MLQLVDWGWDDRFQAHLLSLDVPELLPARVASETRGRYLMFTERSVLRAQMAGKLRFGPATGRISPPWATGWPSLRSTWMRG